MVFFSCKTFVLTNPQRETLQVPSAALAIRKADYHAQGIRHAQGIHHHQQNEHGTSGRHCSFLLRNCLHPSRAKAILQSWAFSFSFPDSHQLGGQLPFGVCSWWCLFRTCMPAALLMKFPSHHGGSGEAGPSHRSTCFISHTHTCNFY